MHIHNRIYYALAVTLLVGAYAPIYAQGSGNQTIEMEKGTTDISYPVAIEKPSGKECGGGKLDKVLQDRVLVYNTPGRGSGNADDIKFWSNQGYIRDAMLLYRNRLAGSGMTTPTTRVCVGFLGRALSLNDYRYIYLWRKVSNRRRP